MLDPGGLSGANWGITIALGSGSLFVGFFIRCLPDFYVPAVLLGGGIGKDTSGPLPVENEKKADTRLSLESDGKQSSIMTAKERFLNALNRRSNRSTHFAPPGHSRRPHSNSVSVPSSIPEGDGVERNWSTFWRYIFAPWAFMKPKEPISQDALVNPRRVREAQIAAAHFRRSQIEQ